MSKNLTTEKKLKLIRKISALADGVTLEYIKRLSEKINSLETDENEKARAFAEIDKVLRIAKQYSERVLLAEGKTTENIGVTGNGGLPFKFVINKHYPASSRQPPVSSNEQKNETADSAD